MSLAAANLRGWGTGWPVGVQSSDLARVSVSGTSFPAGVRVEIAELVSLLVAECKRRGYQFGTQADPSYGCWGYANRPIGGTTTASNHSWGLAVDINAPRNPQSSSLRTDIPEWMTELWKAYGFRWGGDYRPPTLFDPMHFEFAGTPADAQLFTIAARAALGGSDMALTPDEMATLVEIRDNLRKVVGLVSKPGSAVLSDADVARIAKAVLDGASSRLAG